MMNISITSLETFQKIKQEAEELDSRTGNGYLVYSRYMSDILKSALDSSIPVLAKNLELGRLLAEAYQEEMIRRVNDK